MKVLELLSSKDKWTKNADARDKNKQPISSYSLEAVKWSLLGAIHKCYSDHEECSEIYSKIRKRIDFVRSWNDTHSYEEVIELVRELNI